MNPNRAAAILEALPYAAALLKLRKERGQTNPLSVWNANAGAQTMVRETPADWTYMGGEAGGGKTYLALGLAATDHKNTLILRRELEDLKGAEGVIEKSRTLYGPFGSYNGNDRMWKIVVGGIARTVEFAGCQHEQDKMAQQGKPRDLYVFDEAPQFARSQVQFIAGWNRSSDPKQRCRVILTGNPPTTVEGQWIVEMFRPWLDETHPNPALPGEIRWFVTVGDRDLEVESGEPRELDGEMRTPQSRTFIPSRLSENPTYANGKYAIVLDNLPEPLRSQLKKGDFKIGVKSDAFQVIPTEWIRAAQRRWTEKRPGESTTAVGVDIAHGGRCRTVLVERVRNWVGMPNAVEGKDTPTGQATAVLVAEALTRGGYANLDVTGVGSSAYDAAIHMRPPLAVRPITFAAKSELRDRAGVMSFMNTRAWLFWALREALDPDKGDDVALPPHPELLPDLAAPRFAMRTSGIQIESKVEIEKRLGRSPDVGEAVLLSFAPPFMGPKRVVLPPSAPPGTFYGRSAVRGI